MPIFDTNYFDKNKEPRKGHTAPNVNLFNEASKQFYSHCLIVK